ncbi:MAG: GYDIA family GHMP kinase, partial [Bacteroidota bacterium]
MIHEYHSNGKLLLTAEYLVLLGAEALALPLLKGQRLRVKPLIDNNKLIWKSIYQDTTFFEAVFNTKNIHIIQTNNEEQAAYLQNLLQKAMGYLPDLSSIPGFSVEAHLDFPLEWGLGSSSTLISNVAEWLNINPFKLNRAITKGSGYDIACANSERPILFQIPNKYPDYQEINLNPPFKESIFFIYTGKKQSSSDEVNNFLKNTKDYTHLFPKIKEINKRIMHSQSLREYEKALEEHEKLIASVLEIPPIQEKRFTDFPGTVKSLGAWGGDFIMATWEGQREDLEKYFSHHNMDIIFSWDELVKN